MVRPAAAEDLPAVAEVFLAARAAAVPEMPPLVHPDDEVRAHFCGLDLHDPERQMWIAVQQATGATVGFAELRGDWLDDLYVHPQHQRSGVGSVLLDLVRAARPDGFELWVFESNRTARAFYRRHGLVELELTDGSGNEERAPDVRVAWPGVDPVARLRAHVDAVDDELAVLLGRRAALTAAVQRYKEVPGHAGRDPEREAAIVRRMSARAPGVPEEFWRRVVHEVITVSLDVADDGRAAPRDRSSRPS